MKMKIVVVGLGGVGGYYGGLLARKYEGSSDIEIYFLARGAHLQKIQKEGLKVIAETETFIAHPELATDQVAEIGKVDYTILYTNSHDQSTTVRYSKALVRQDPVILPLLNGAEMNKLIRELLPDTVVRRSGNVCGAR